MTSSPVSSFLLDNRRSILAFAVVSYIASICIYRRFFHPLAKVPGPFLPAITKLYQSFYHGRYYLQIEKLHKQYGPIIRITPDEVHLAEPENYDKIYYVGTKYWKSPVFYNALCVPHSTFGTPPNDLHKIRRGALNPMFSRQKVLELEGIVQGKADKVCRRLQASIDKDEEFDLHHAFRAVSIDVISEFGFGQSYDFLDRDDLGAEFFAMSRGIGPALWAFQQFPSFQSMALKSPPWLAPYLSKPLGYITAMQMECARQIEGVKAKVREGKDVGRQTIFTTLLSEENKPEGYRIPGTWAIKDEAYSVLAAAADTTGNAMSVCAFHVLYNRGIYQKLVGELEARFPSQTQGLPYLELEKLHYLTAVIQEGLRLSFGVIGRLPRVVPPPGATFHSQYLPPDTIVSMSSWLMHRDPEVFVAPMKFDPERWLKSSDETRRLERNMIPFGRGTRQCVGMALGYTELYVAIGTLFRRYPKGLQVWKTTPDLMCDYEDFFSSFHPQSRREEWLKAYMEHSDEAESTAS